MSIKSQGGVFGRNPTFNDVTVDGDLSIAGTLTIGGETITGLSYQGGWNASTNTPDIAASSPVTGQFWIVSADGSTDVGGITNWTSGDWALYDGSAWQRVEGGNTDLTTGVQGQLAVANGGTGAADAATARTNLGLGTAATTASTDYATAAQGALADSALQSSDIGVSVQGYDATILTSSDIGSTVQGYDATILTSSDIGSTVQAYDADTAKYDAATAAFTGNLSVDSTTLYVDATNNATLIGTSTWNTTYDPKLQVQSAANDGTQGVLVASYKPSVTFFDYSGGTPAVHRIAADSGRLGFEIDTAQNGSFTEAFAVTAAGNIAMANGNGIDFSATSGTGTSELFDDYEEGTWTATVGCTGNGTTTTTKTGYYTKVGRQVTVSLRSLDNISTTGLSGFLTVTLPFTCITADVGFFGPTGWGSLTYPSGYDTILANTGNGSSAIAFSIHGNGSVSSLLDVSSITSGTTDLSAMTLTYFTA